MVVVAGIPGSGKTTLARPGLGNSNFRSSPPVNEPESEQRQGSDAEVDAGAGSDHPHPHQ